MVNKNNYLSNQNIVNIDDYHQIFKLSLIVFLEVYLGRGFLFLELTSSNLIKYSGLISSTWHNIANRCISGKDTPVNHLLTVSDDIGQFAGEIWLNSLAMKPAEGIFPYFLIKAFLKLDMKCSLKVASIIKP